MSQANVEIAKRVLDAFNHYYNLPGDRAQPPSLPEFFHPNVEWDLSRREIDGEVYHGYEGWMRLSDQYRDAWQEFRMKAEEVIDAGESVVLFTHNTGLARSSGIRFGIKVGHVFTFRDGKIVRSQYFGEDRAACLKAAGLAE